MKKNNSYWKIFVYIIFWNPVGMEFFKKILRDLYFLYDINISYRNFFKQGVSNRKWRFLVRFQYPMLEFFQILLEFKFLFGFFILLWNSQHPIGKLFFFHWKNDFLVETHSLKGIILLDGLGFCFITKVVIAMVYHITYWNF